jgi:hypothetical protein
VGFFRDQRTEQWLDRSRVPWEYRQNVLLAQVDQAASLRNQARLDEPLNRDRVTEYAVLMLDGVEFPALIAYQGQKGWVIISGNHRYAAAKEADTPTVDLYHATTADTDLYVRELLTRTANIIEGKGLTNADERMEHAVQMCRTSGRSHAVIGREFNIPESTLANRLRRMATDERLVKLGVAPDKLPQITRFTLARIYNDMVLKQTAELALTAKLSEGEVRVLAKELETIRTEADQIWYLQTQREALQTRVHELPANKTQWQVRNKLFHHLAEANRLLREHRTPASLQVTDRAGAQHLDDAVRDLTIRSAAVIRLVREQTSVVINGQATKQSEYAVAVTPAS